MVKTMMVTTTRKKKKELRKEKKNRGELAIAEWGKRINYSPPRKRPST
jgi:hypothetical protein